MIFTLFIITILYVILIGALIYGFNKVDTFKTEDMKAETKFSIIIPFRNEAENLPDLLLSISNLKYPKSHFEIIFVDDASSDASVEIINECLNKKPFDCAQADKNVLDTIPKAIESTRTDTKVINNNRKTNSPKKDAITSAIEIAKYNWIVTTDADCVLPKFWLNSFDCFIQKNNCEMVVAPVTYHEVNSALKKFQLLDFLSLIGATIGGFGIEKPFLCNGANLAYKKSLFLKLNGFDGNDTIASGDDIFLLQKAIEKDKKTVRFLKCKSTIVKTKPQPNLKSLISQRKRWAAKTSSYNSVFGKGVGLVVLLMNAALICAFTFCLIGLFHFKLILYIFIIKSLIDFLLIFKTARFFQQEQFLLSFLFSAFIYPFFTVYIAFISLFSKYKWKGRTFKK